MRMSGKLLAGVAAPLIALAGGPAGMAYARSATVEATPVKRVIATTAAQSTPAFPSQPKAPQGAPNILLVMTDDVGFAAASTFGGLIPTPALDRLAAAGLRYSNFNTTAMCSPSRAALLTGRNHHVAGTGALPDLATGFPGYVGEIPRNTATIAEILRANGYSTALFGKHHNVPTSEITTAGPFDSWPVGLGFEYFYGFVASQTDQWAPILYRGTSRVEAPAGKALDALLVDDAIKWLHNQQASFADKPFFIYLAPGTAHAPLQAPEDWIARFRGKFDQGWDKLRAEIFARQKRRGVIPQSAGLTPRPDFIPAWNSLSPAQQRVAARLMEVFAAQLAFQDAQFGRLMDELDRMGEAENTLVVFIEGDNGASSEGGRQGTTNDFGYLLNAIPETGAWLASQIDNFGKPGVHAHYPMGWAWSMNTPFPYFKRYASHLGGIRNGMVVSWPHHFTGSGTTRFQFTHLVDVAPTLLDAAGLSAPDSVHGVPQRPMDGASFMPTLTDARAPTRTLQYFEMLGNRALYHDGWMASTTPPEAQINTQLNAGKFPSPDSYAWELYDLNRDFSQSRNLARQHPRKLQEMQARFAQEAERNQVYPLDNAMDWARVLAEPRERRPVRARYVYWGEGVELGRGIMAPILDHSFTLDADVMLTADRASGVIAAVGDKFGGWGFYLQDGYPLLYEAYSDQPGHQYRLKAQTPLGKGKNRLRFDVRYLEDGSTKIAIFVNGEQAGEGAFPHRIHVVTQGEMFTIGHEQDAPVAAELAVAPFPGVVEKIVITLPDVAASAIQDGQ